MGYDISADYVDSTTTYEPRSTIIDPDFIGGHSKYIHINFDKKYPNSIRINVRYELIIARYSHNFYKYF